ncbi:type I-E CRISPR-associated protein Cse2/CasB [Pontibaca methylaminivorans]|uniref:CRISPR-associated protein, Cse2 family n=1 Tax=Pontibaca methylaminivorans TaxID=515897 RepID=A0A1R3X1V1_9RHOB|nr:type I-E CRISPR-associated protein Cse2/CasB [Pontibaca methylaminivorans]SIT84534.1 CRISPR-associated protein, Cse2 family [Pontibaca methylaminivorans]
MSDATKNPGQIALGWWKQTLRPDDDTGPARALRARLRRADHVTDILAEGRVIELHDRLGRKTDALTLAALAQVLAHVERHDGRRIAQVFGAGDPEALSPLRFQRLIRSDDRRELATGLRRALPLAGRACNVAALAEDILFWGEKSRIRWCFDYYGAAPPRPAAAEEETE